MKGIAKRSKLMFALVAIFLAGVIVLAATFGINAEAWVFKRANKHIYSSGQIVAAGTIYDRNGKVLAQTVNGERKYNSNSTVRRATLHAVGDLEGFISTGAHSAFRSQLTGYSFLNGVYDLKRNGAGNDITLTIDADLCVTAYNALNGRKAQSVYITTRLARFSAWSRPQLMTRIISLPISTAIQQENTRQYISTASCQACSLPARL